MAPDQSDPSFGSTISKKLLEQWLPTRYRALASSSSIQVRYLLSPIRPALHCPRKSLVPLDRHRTCTYRQSRRTLQDRFLPSVDCKMDRRPLVDLLFFIKHISRLCLTQPYYSWKSSCRTFAHYGVISSHNSIFIPRRICHG